MKWCILSFLLCSIVIVLSQDIQTTKDDTENSISSLDGQKESDPPNTTTSTTSSPKTTTSTTSPKTTTSTTSPKTTTTTTTSAPKTTTTETPPPIKEDYFSVTERNTTCIMIGGNFEFTITYKIGNNATNKTSIKLPKPTDASHPRQDGSCNAEGLQYIEITWSDSVPPNSLVMFFNSSADGKSWHILNTTAQIFLDVKNFPNATKLGKALKTKFIYDLTPNVIHMNHSYTCYSDETVTNSSTTIEGVAYDLPVWLSMSAVRIEAYNKIPLTKDFVEANGCSSESSTISPVLTPRTTTSTPTPATTPKPRPQVDYYNITEDSVTCIMLEGNLTFNVTYDTENKEKRHGIIKVPKPNDALDIKVNGSCSDLQYISISWKSKPQRSKLQRSNLTLIFNATEDGQSWKILNATAFIFMDEELFQNATNMNKTLRSEIHSMMDLDHIAVNRSYFCYYGFSTINISTYLDEKNYTEPISLSMSKVKIQAFNQIRGTNDFATATRCVVDFRGDVLPVVVGLCIAGVGLIVALVYCLARRRSRRQYITYQSI